MLTVNLNIGDCPVTVDFTWKGRDEDSGPNWDTMEVIAALPGIFSRTSEPEWVKINDLLSDDQWAQIEHAIHENWSNLQKQAFKNEY